MNLLKESLTVAFTGLFLGQLVPASQAALFLDSESFEAAVASANLDRAVLDFEDMAAGSLILSGNGVAGITFEYDIPGFDIGIEGNSNGISPGTSGDNNLAVTPDGGQGFGGFALGDSIRFLFDEPMYGFGFFVIVGSLEFPWFAEDINLSIGSTTYSTAGGESATLRGGVSALFFGVLEDQPFTEATLRFGETGATSGGMFWVDEINTVAVPEPAAYAFGVGIMALVVLFRRDGRKASGQAKGAAS